LPAASAIPGPGRWETLRALFPIPFYALPQFLETLAPRYGPIARFALPWAEFVFLNDPALIKDVLVTQQHAFTKSEGAHTMRMLLGEGLLTSEEPHHRQMRRIVQPAFHRERIAGYGRTMLAFAGEWVSKHDAGATFDMHAEMSELTLRIASSTLFGVDAGAQAQRVRDALHQTLEVFPAAIGPIGAIRRRLPLASNRRFECARAVLDEIIFGLIAERRRSGEQRADALSLLLESADPETGRHLDDQQVRDEAMTLFLAGHETTANALVWTWYLLSQHPQIETQMHAEVDALESLDDPVRALTSLSYTRRVLQESMRLYPPAWIIGRKAREDVVLAGGYHIPSGTTVFAAPLILHRQAQFFADPLRFDPDRWRNGDVAPFAYIPFGGGARKCIGEEFAWMEGALLLATLARAFRFSFASDRPPETQPLITLRPKGAVPMRATVRSREHAACPVL
jgi:cytochrome P450